MSSPNSSEELQTQLLDLCVEICQKSNSETIDELNKSFQELDGKITQILQNPAITNPDNASLELENIYFLKKDNLLLCQVALVRIIIKEMINFDATNFNKFKNFYLLLYLLFHNPKSEEFKNPVPLNYAILFTFSLRFFVMAFNRNNNDNNSRNNSENEEKAILMNFFKKLFSTIEISLTFFFRTM